MSANLGQAAQRAIANPVSQKSTETPDYDRAAQIWAMLVQSFGVRFANEYGDEPNHAWAEAFGAFNDDEIRKGIRNLNADNLRFAPTLSQFQSACRRWSGRPHQAPQIEHKQDKSAFLVGLDRLRELMHGEDTAEKRADRKKLFRQLFGRGG